MSDNKQGAFMKIENSFTTNSTASKNNSARLRGMSLCVTGYSSQHPTDATNSDIKTINIGSLPMNDTAQEEMG